MNDSVIGLDIAKNVFHVFTVSAEGKAVKKAKTRGTVDFFRKPPEERDGS